MIEPMELGIEGRAAIVTGGSRGIGLAVAERLVAEGSRVLIVARGAATVAAAAERIGCAALAADVTAPGAGELIVDHARSTLGGVDILVNNAGTSRNVPLDRLDDDDWEEQLALGVMAPMRLMRAAAPLMALAGWGRIVNVSSSSGKRPSASNAAYSVAKAGMLSLSRAYADAFAARGVLVNAVAPGPVATGLWTGSGGLAEQIAARSGSSADDALAAAGARIPRGRLADAGEIADVIAFLCSERAANVAGAAWSVDGGAVGQIV